MRTKLRIVNSNVKSVLFSGCETRLTTQTLQQKIQTFFNRRSEMKIYGSERDRNQWQSRCCGGSGAGSDTPSGSQYPAPQAKPRPGTRKRGEREAGLATVGGETLKQN